VSWLKLMPEPSNKQPIQLDYGTRRPHNPRARRLIRIVIAILVAASLLVIWAIIANG
jgi:hypothetical protein